MTSIDDKDKAISLIATSLKKELRAYWDLHKAPMDLDDLNQYSYMFTDDMNKIDVIRELIKLGLITITYNTENKLELYLTEEYDKILEQKTGKRSVVESYPAEFWTGWDQDEQ